jgi:transposase
MKGILIMSPKERHRLKVLTQIEKRHMTFREAAEELQLSQRQVYRLMDRYHKHGDAGLIHRLRGTPSNRGYGEKVRTQVLILQKHQYPDYGPTLLGEMLVQYHSLHINHETLRRWLRSAGRVHFERSKRPHRRKRERRSAIGALVQFDGSPHDWFEGRGPACCLLHAIDDASGRIFMRFAPSENTADALATLRAYCEHHGIPKALYTDHGSVFYAEGKLTDVGRAMTTLGVQMIFANSPQAKGRVERGNRTHQDRLIKALRREGISIIAQANHFLASDYNDDHNTRFASQEQLPDVHRPCDGYDFNNIFCFQTERQVRNDYTITLEATFVQLLRSENPLPPPRQYVTVRRWLDGSLHIFWKEHDLDFSVLKAKPKAQLPRHPTPAADHPWRLARLGRYKRHTTIGATPVALRAPSVAPESS